MPLYQYHCPDCNKDFERRASMAERGRKQECPTCGGKADRRAVTAFAAMVGGGSSNAMDFSGDCAGGACESGPSMAGTCCGGGGCAH